MSKGEVAAVIAGVIVVLGIVGGIVFGIHIAGTNFLDQMRSCVDQGGTFIDRPRLCLIGTEVAQ